MAVFAGGGDVHVFVLENRQLVSLFWGAIPTPRWRVLVVKISGRGLILIMLPLALKNRAPIADVACHGCGCLRRGDRCQGELGPQARRGLRARADGGHKGEV